MAPNPNVGSERANEAGFFIASRLRGIPLVSQRSETRPSSSSSSSQQTQTSSSKREDSTTSSVTANQITVADANASAALANSEPQQRERLNQVGKRDASQGAFDEMHGARIQNQTEILFKQTGVTSSIANLVKSTTRRPHNKQKTTSTATTRHPTITTRKAQARLTTTRRATTTTTRRPKTSAARRAGSVSTKITSGNNQQARESATTTSMSSTPAMLIEPISSHKMSTLEAASADSGPLLVAVSSLPSLVTSPMITATMATTTVRYQQTATEQHHQATLTRSMQTLTTQPVNQRRGQQNVVQSRSGSNRFLNDPRNGYAGENWYLFNRSDGNVSAFEILVLVSNVLIISTIILVILFNWIKLFKRRRSNGAAGDTQPKEQQTAVAAVENGLAAHHNNNTSTVHKLDTGSDRASKISLISSGVSQVTSVTTSVNDVLTTTTATSPSVAAATSGNAKQVVKQQLEEGKRLVSVKGDELVSDAHKITSEFYQSSANLANKAMAIVQPTENNFRSGLDTSLDKLKKELKNDLAGGARSISRSVSDLSGGAGIGSGNRPSEETVRASATNTPDRVQALEKLFESTSKKEDQQATKSEPSKKGSSKGDDERLIHSSSSLESIELPNNLVESIKRTATGPLRTQVDETLAPSPNLLLGEVTTDADQAQKVTEKADQTVASQQQQKMAEMTNKSDTRMDQSNVNRPQNPMANLMTDTKQPEVNGTKSGSEGPKTMSSNKEATKKAKPEDRPTPQKPSANEQSKPAVQKPAPPATEAKQQQQQQQTAEVKNHQVVVNRLDKRKTDLEIVDLRDESVTGKMRLKPTDGAADQSDASNSAWISMDGVAVVQPHSIVTNSPAAFVGSGSGAGQQQLGSPTEQQAMSVASQMSPSEIIESRFHVDYKSKRRQQKVEGGQVKNSESMDSKQEEYVFNNIENELELDNKMKNRKYFVYVVHDGHFTAKKECIARIELPPKRRITLAELRQLISNSQDISLSSLRRNRFKFVTETYRLLNENEDAAVLHQVYPTQGVFLKLNVAEQENQVYPFKGGRNARLSSGGGAGSSSLAQGGSSLSNTTIASRRRANVRTGGVRNPHAGGQDGSLPAIEVNNYGQTSSRARATSVSRGRQASGGNAGPGATYRRSKSSVQIVRNNRSSAGGMRHGASGGNLSGNDDPLPSIGMSHGTASVVGDRKLMAARNRANPAKPKGAPLKQTIGGAASDLGANMISGAKKLLSSTFGL